MKISSSMPVWTIWFAIAALLVLGGPALAQFTPPKPGPEHDKLKQLEGTWEAAIKMPEGDSKGTMTYKMDLGGFWLVGDYQGEFFGQKFQGRSFEGYDPTKKKYVAIWMESMSPAHMTMEGEFDKDQKVLTMTGDGPDHTGKIVKWKSVMEFKDKDTMVTTMTTIKDGKESPMMTITYKRKK